MIKKIDIGESLDEKVFDYHDLLRDGKMVELSPMKVCVLLKKIVMKINDLVDEVNKKS